MRRAAVLLAAIVLAGCLPDQAKDMAVCQSEVMRFYPTYVASNPDDPGTRYIIGCMAAKGYDFEVAAADCDSRYPLPTQAACYRPQGWLARVIDQFRRPAKAN
jgi:hypothetical protein